MSICYKYETTNVDDHPSPEIDAAWDKSFDCATLVLGIHLHEAVTPMPSIRMAFEEMHKAGEAVSPPKVKYPDNVGGGFMVSSNWNSLTYYINLLRKALSDPAQKPKLPVHSSSCPDLDADTVLPQRPPTIHRYNHSPSTFFHKLYITLPVKVHIFQYPERSLTGTLVTRSLPSPSPSHSHLLSALFHRRLHCHTLRSSFTCAISCREIVSMFYLINTSTSHSIHTDSLDGNYLGFHSLASRIVAVNSIFPTPVSLLAPIRDSPQTLFVFTNMIFPIRRSQVRIADVTVL
ncbi:hypothetical protein F4604DRAFT_1959249 [Suillus subluteus]|nr:hypothetical protein F4604DRAFT_1959249 [Suillus subluteus]